MSVAVTLAVFAMVPVAAILLPEWPANIGLGPYGAAVSPSPTRHQSNPFAVAVTALFRASHSFDFWLLALSFAICGLSTNALINPHLIAYCADRGISEVAGAGILASLGVFSLIGATGSRWMCDRFNPRVLLFWYYCLRGLSLVIIPFTQFDLISLSIFSILYGLDWVATGPATFALTNQLFGRRDTPVIISWIFAAHQIGGAVAAFGAGAARSFTPNLSCMAARPLTDVGRKADQISVRGLDEELMHTRLDLTGAIPLLLRLHEQRPVGMGERCQDRLDRRHVDLKIHPAPERNFHWSRLPISGSGTLIQHDLSPAEIEIGETFIGAVEEDREPAQVTPKPQAFFDIGHEELGDQACPGKSRRGGGV